MADAGLAQGERREAPAAWVLCAIGAAGAASIPLTIWLGVRTDHPVDHGINSALLCFVTVTYVASGLVAWWRRPENPFGKLLIVTGFAWFVANLGPANAALPYTLGALFGVGPLIFVLHVFLAFPTGRLDTRFERLLVAAGYVLGFGLQVVLLLFLGADPRILLAVTSDPDVFDVVLRAQAGLVAVVLFVGVGILLARRFRGRRPLRRRIAWLVDGFALSLLALGVLAVAGALAWKSETFVWIQRIALFTVGLAPLVFLAGILQARLARSAVADLMLDLRSNPEPSGLRDALARALRDPSLTLLYWLPEYEGWADLDGRAVELGAPAAGRARTSIERGGDPVAVLDHDDALEDERELLDAVAAVAAIALENARLNVELRARLVELQGSRARIVEAGDSERRRLERNLHDGAQQRLVALALQLRLLRSRIAADPAQAAALAESASDELAQSLDELRELARGLHPAVLERGLEPALRALANRSKVATSVRYELDARLPQPVELAAYFVAAEALTNVAKYAEASEASVCVRQNGTMATIVISDDGVGGADEGRGSGLRGLADRVEALEGRLLVVSPPGAGTTVTAELPCRPEA